MLIRDSSFYFKHNKTECSEFRDQEAIMLFSTLSNYVCGLIRYLCF